MIPDDFRVADDLYPTPPVVAGWLRLCWLYAGCIIVMQPGYSQHSLTQPASSSHGRDLGGKGYKSPATMSDMKPSGIVAMPLGPL